MSLRGPRVPAEAAPPLMRSRSASAVRDYAARKPMQDQYAHRRLVWHALMALPEGADELMAWIVAEYADAGTLLPESVREVAGIYETFIRGRSE